MRYCSLLSLFCHSASLSSSLGTSTGSESFPSLLITRTRAMGAFLSVLAGSGAAALAVGWRSQEHSPRTIKSEQAKRIRMIVKTRIGHLVFPIQKCISGQGLEQPELISIGLPASWFILNNALAFGALSVVAMRRCMKPALISLLGLLLSSTTAFAADIPARIE